ncbi:IclR family transcriptional regulator [Variovorax terrae]|uniref:IclR family transcriptional regulator n=1 Tax=Variovorax terrae TaxID=2923278 RepID=A0A9X1VXG2_9BURK|nr:IclR family transcriptional regulator [Variovorax terrae]MCJ0764889.1 IclR family transcriptional regulator [Variovorax terrae]
MANQPDTGSLKRGVLLLKSLATAGTRGLALTEVSQRAGTPHPSTHRVLGQLIAEGLAEYVEETRRYRLGPLVFELGLASAVLHDIRDLCQEPMAGLSFETEDTVYLVVRSGFEAVCMHRIEGSFPIRTLVLQVGSRRPLGVGAGGLAILSAIEPEERDRTIARIASTLKAYGKLSARALTEACVLAHDSGVAVVRDIVTLGVTGVGVPFRNPAGQPIGALSVAALSQRMTPRRVQRIAHNLKAAAAEVERKLRVGGR